MVAVFVFTYQSQLKSDDLSNEELECLVIEISKPRSTAYLVGTWYRPSSSPTDLFGELLPKLTPKIRNYIYLVMSKAICCLKQMITFLPF